MAEQLNLGSLWICREFPVRARNVNNNNRNNDNNNRNNDNNGVARCVWLVSRPRPSKRRLRLTPELASPRRDDLRELRIAEN
jgi:hypothetical protein